jgi:hypothetical protein
VRDAPARLRLRELACALEGLGRRDRELHAPQVRTALLLDRGERRRVREITAMVAGSVAANVSAGGSLVSVVKSLIRG